MRFATNYGDLYQILARPDVTKIVQDPRGPEWGTQTVILQEAIWIKFTPRGHLAYAEREKAQNYFDPPGEDGLRPGPYRNAGVAGDPDFDGMTYDASDHWLHYSTYDTEKDCPIVSDLSPDDVKALIEKTLTASTAFGRDYIRVDDAAVAEPWPGYADTHHKSIAVVAKSTRRDPRLVIEYEKTHQNRLGVIADLEKLIGEAQQEAANEEELTVRG